jgi:hypothetical protein
MPISTRSSGDSKKLGFTNTARRLRVPRPKGTVTQQQLDLIAALYTQLGWTELPRQIGFSKRCCRKSWPQTRTDANKVIEGLKAMLGRINVENPQP